VVLRRAFVEGLVGRAWGPGRPRAPMHPGNPQVSSLTGLEGFTSTHCNRCDLVRCATSTSLCAVWP